LNKHWLAPYSAFCFLRDKYGTSDFKKWKMFSTFNAEEVSRLCSPRSKLFKEISFWYFVQYHLHLQLKDAVKYAHKKGVAIKGDIPIGIYRFGSDAWSRPDLFYMDQQAGAPPDDFAIKGQNWGFPTYNWLKMQEDDFAWWRLRFDQMSYYFDAFRIDHILGFFRIWSIPMDAVEGILGRFVPANPLSMNDFAERGITVDHQRLCSPYITKEILQQTFGDHADSVMTIFIDESGEGQLKLKEEFSTQRKVTTYFDNGEQSGENAFLKQGLFDLVSNVLLIEDDTLKEHFHFRINMDVTASFHFLDGAQKHALKELYVHYFYRLQDDAWKMEALKKLPALKEATNMLICGEDLGMVPHCVPNVMKDLGILSLEIQRMPKNPATLFFHPASAPYLSVVTPSTHDMSTIRGWWEEDRQKTQQFYNSVLEEAGDAPFFCEPWINTAIVMQHLYSPAMWSIFQIQDLLGMNAELRRNNPHEERINIPAIAEHYWRYRMHITLEDLFKEKDFNNFLGELISNSGRG
jgi:4-alpha-glucanotransferase